jgi:hypothetical protein
VKFLFPLALLATFALSACNTIENRRSLYTTEKVHGPYTRQLEEGTWGNPQTVQQQYADQQRTGRAPKLLPGAKSSSDGGVEAGSVPTPATELPAQ